MKNEKLANILEGIILIVLGVFVAIYGGGRVVDTYFAIVALVAGVILALVAILELADKKPLPLKPVVVSGALISVAIGLFTGWLSFAQLINLFVLVILGIGAGLIIYSLFLFSKSKTSLAVCVLIIGTVLVVLAALYMGVPDFRKAFWIIVGIVIAVEGALLIAASLIENKGKKRK